MKAAQFASAIIAACGAAGADPEDVMDPEIDGRSHPEVSRVRRAMLLACPLEGSKLSQYAVQLGWWGGASAVAPILSRAKARGEDRSDVFKAAYHAFRGAAPENVSAPAPATSEPTQTPEASPPVPLHSTAKPRAPVIALKPKTKGRATPPVAPVKIQRTALSPARKRVPLRRMRRAFPGAYPVAETDHASLFKAKAAIRLAAAKRPDLKPAALAIKIAVDSGFVCSSRLIKTTLAERRSAEGA